MHAAVPNCDTEYRANFGHHRGKIAVANPCAILFTGSAANIAGGQENPHNSIGQATTIGNQATGQDRFGGKILGTCQL